MGRIFIRAVEAEGVNLTRHQVLAGLLVVTLLLAALVLSSVLWTAVFGVTVAYVLVPVVDWLEERGLSPTWASVLASVAGTVLLLVLFALLGFLAYRRRGAVIDFVTNLPDSVTLAGFGYSYVVETHAALDAATAWLSGLALEAATALPTLGLKVALFSFVVFGLLVGHEAVEAALLAAIPDDYHDVAHAFASRIKDTLWAIYVLQVATGVATFLLALPVFVLLGYDIPLTLAFVAGVLQFLPIVGPSVLLAALAIYQVVIGELLAAVLLVAIGGVVIAWVPDILVRPRLARSTGRLPGTLYLIGFVGGLLTVGPVGIIVGPLAVALVVEAVQMLQAEGP